MVKTKVKATVKVAAKNALRQKRKVAAKKRRETRRKSRQQKTKESQTKADAGQRKASQLLEEEEDLDDLIAMTDPEYLPAPRNAPSKSETSDVEADCLEARYEGKRQKIELESKEKHLLPIKTSAGFVERTIVEEEPVEGSKGETVDCEDDEDAQLSPEEIRERREAAEADYRVKIGNWSSLLVEDPELNVEHLKHIVSILGDKRSIITPATRLLAILSLREVFLDIIPDYRIAQHNTETNKVKKETLRLWKYENNLLSAYKTYLLKLESFSAFLKQHRSAETPSNPRLRNSFRLAAGAVTCMRDLLLRHPHFNFSGNLTKIIVHLSAHPHPDVGLPCSQGLRSLLRQDNVGEVSLQAVKHVYAMAKRKNYQLPSRIFDALLALRIQHVKPDEEVRAEMQRKMIEQKSMNRMSRKDRKRRMLEDEVKRDMELTMAEESAEKKQKFQTETLNVVFTIYFRVLKSRPNPKLLTACLEGLAKYAHLINLDFFPDLVNVLHNLAAHALADDDSDVEDEDGDSGLGEDSSVDDGGRLTPWQALHCVRTAFSVVSGQGRALTIEPTRFYALLYNALLAVHAGVSDRDQLTGIETCVVALTERRKTLSLCRCLAFCKRLLTMATHQTHQTALAYLNVCRILMTTNKSSLSLVDLGEEGPAGRGLFNPYAKDPEHSMAQTAIGWELAALQRHYNPAVSKLAKHLAHGCPPSGKGHLPPELAKLDVAEMYGLYSMGDGSRFRPPIPPPPEVKEKVWKDRAHTWRDLDLRRSVGELLDSEFRFVGCL